MAKIVEADMQASSLMLDSDTVPPSKVPSADVASPRDPRTRRRTRSQSLTTGCEETAQQSAPPLKLDFARRIPYGLDSFFYPDPIPLSHLQRLLHVIAAIEYVQMRYRGHDLARQKNFQSDNIAGSVCFLRIHRQRA